MRPFSLVARGALALAFVSFPAFAQFTTSKITFRNPGPFPPAALEQTTGLHGGQQTSRDGIQAAAQHLMDTGFFDDVKVDSKGTPGAMEVIFILTPESAAKEISAGFENFVWLTPEELRAAIHKDAPLFQDKLPEAGNQTETIEAALQTALVAKGITRRVVHETLEPTINQPMRLIEFRVEPSVRVGAVSLTGVPAELAAAQDKIAQGLSGSAYKEGSVGDATAGFLLEPSRNAGFLEARLTGTQRMVNPAGRVDISAALDTGPVYRFGKVTYVHPEPVNGALPVGEAVFEQATVKLRPGDIAARGQLLSSTQAIDDAYKKLGYMDVYVNPGEALDTATHTANYNLAAAPGEIYRLRSVTPLGLSAAAQAEFDKAWRMKPGDPYSAGYVSHFIENNSAMRALATYAATFQASADPSTHLVDLTVKFAPSGVPMRR